MRVKPERRTNRMLITITQAVGLGEGPAEGWGKGEAVAGAGKVASGGNAVPTNRKGLREGV